MGYYIQTGCAFGKATDIIIKHGAKWVSREQAKDAIDDGSLAVVCVKTNDTCDAAGFCFSEDEFNEFDKPSDRRPTMWLIMDRKLCEMLTGFNDTPVWIYRGHPVTVK